ncbi:MAG: EamA family transporter [Candidatus Yanofskybacteria bacterium]|nr:EamA family transporter [Candidatus Yanofskybacteria bacterium]
MWLYLALIAYLINSIVFIIDKYLLSGHIPKYHAYAFGVSILSLSAVFLIPFGVSWPGLTYFYTAVFSGAAFFVGLMFLYKSIKESDVSIAATQTGTMSSIFTYVFSILILKEALPLLNVFAFLFLILGIFLLGKIEKHILLSAVLAGLSFGISYVLLKLLFNHIGFIDGLFWTRMGFVGSAFLSLASSHVRREVRFSLEHAPNKSKFLFIFNKILAGIGFIILYFSINLGSVSLVNALLGFQFLFTFILVLFLRERIYEIKENTNRYVLANKLAGITSVLIGFLFLFLGND